VQLGGFDVREVNAQRQRIRPELLSFSDRVGESAAGDGDLS
jgi:hypothetical protein